MAAGAVLFPVSTYPSTSGKVFPNFHIGAGSYSKQTEGLGYMASLDADAYWELRFRLPPSLPSGTCSFNALCLANATSGAAKLTVLAGMCDVDAAPDAVNVAAETEATLTWAAGENDKFKELSVTLENTTPVADQVMVVRIKGATSGWTLAATLTIASPCLKWE